jgi:hypothetical protein
MRSPIVFHCLVGLSITYALLVALDIYLVSIPPAAWTTPPLMSVALAIVMCLAASVGAALIALSVRQEGKANYLGALLLAAAPYSLGEISALGLAIFRPMRLPTPLALVLAALSLSNFGCWATLVWLHASSSDKR